MKGAALRLNSCDAQAVRRSLCEADSRTRHTGFREFRVWLFLSMSGYRMIHTDNLITTGGFGFIQSNVCLLQQSIIHNTG